MTRRVISENVDSAGRTHTLTAAVLSDDDDVTTMLTVRRGHQTLFGGGMGGPGVSAGKIMNFYTGMDTDSGITAVVVRTTTAVKDIALAGPSGSSSPVKLTAVPGRPDLLAGAALVDPTSGFDRLIAKDAAGDILTVEHLPNLAARKSRLAAQRPNPPDQPVGPDSTLPS